MTTSRGPVVIFLIALVVYGFVSGGRLRAQSADRHFVALASAWLHGRLDLDRWPDGADDPAVVEHVVLDDGGIVRGRRLLTRDAFRIAGGEEIPIARIRASRGFEYHVAFPPFPAAVFVPMVLVFGPAANDIIATVLLGALVPALFLVVLRRLRERGLSTRSPGDELWLTVLLSFGTVLFFSTVQGRVWYTAHVIALDLSLLYVWASIDAGRPFLAGTFLGLAFLTRGQLLFMFPFFVAEMWRTGQRTELRRWAAFVAPVAVLGLLAAWHNHARFGEMTEFGYSYLAVRQQLDVERFGLFSLHYLPRNLYAAFLLLPQLSAHPPYVTISGHGLAMWITTPPLVLLFASRPRGTFHRGLWITAAAVGVWPLFYQNTGWLQFGYRFSLDYLVFLLLLLVVDSRPLTAFARGLVVVAVAVNLFGAVTFGRYHQFYRADAAAYRALVHD
ncbi:MAG: hypothetical protein LAO77_07510 [Acidobacteriia bacterium]|nr:hypothetical protein [Terriglobia bacterium]